MSDPALIERAVKLAVVAPAGPSVRQAAEGAPIPADAWEYLVRKASNDAAFQNLDYVPYCSCMPTCKGGCTNPHFMEDRFMRGGRLLAAAAQGPDPLERLLGAARLALDLLSDIARSSSEASDTPVTTLGQHYITHRDLGAAAHGASGVWRAYAQELCTFDAQEGPKAHVGCQGPPVAALHLVLAPVARTKAKRLGRQLEVKVSLSGPQPSSVVLQLAPPHAQDPSGKQPAGGSALPPTATSVAGAATSQAGAPSTSSAHQQPGKAAAAAVPAAGSEGSADVLGPGPAGGEVYALQLPDLVLGDPLGPEARLGFKGELAVSCAATGWAALLTVAKDGRVGGTLEQRQQPSEGGGGRRGSKAGQVVVVGGFSGGWASRVSVSCPKMGLEGVVFDADPTAMLAGPGEAGSAPGSAAGAGRLGPIMATVRLARLGPVAMPRLWAALHDALLYPDLAAASGGRAAVQLACRLPLHLRGLGLEGAATRDVGPAPSMGAPGGGAAGAAPLAAGQGTTGGGDADVAEFDRLMAAAASEGGGSDCEADPREVPPAYKAQHAAGRRLRYQLHLSLVAAGVGEGVEQGVGQLVAGEGREAAAAR